MDNPGGDCCWLGAYARNIKPMGYQWGFKIIADFGTNFFVTFVPKLDHLRKTGTVEVEGGYDTPIL